MNQRRSYRGKPDAPPLAFQQGRAQRFLHVADAFTRRRQRHVRARGAMGNAGGLSHMQEQSEVNEIEANGHFANRSMPSAQPEAHLTSSALCVSRSLLRLPRVQTPFWTPEKGRRYEGTLAHCQKVRRRSVRAHCRRGIYGSREGSRSRRLDRQLETGFVAGRCWRRDAEPVWIAPERISDPDTRGPLDGAYHGRRPQARRWARRARGIAEVDARLQRQIPRRR